MLDAACMYCTVNLITCIVTPVRTTLRNQQKETKLWTLYPRTEKVKHADAVTRRGGKNIFCCCFFILFVSFFFFYI